MRTIFFIIFLAASVTLYGETFKLGDGMTATVTPTHYKLSWSQTSRNGGTVRGTFSGPMKNGKRTGTWTASITFNKYLPDGAGAVRTGTISMTRNYLDGLLHGAYIYNQKLNFRDIVHTSSGWKYSAEAKPENMSVKGTFDKGRFDGAWQCNGDELLLSTYTAQFNKGVPEYIKEKDSGRMTEIFYTDSLTTRYVTTSSNGSVEGWRSKPGTDLMTVRRYKDEPQHGLSKSDDNPLYGFQYDCTWCEYVVPRRIAKWLLYNPSGASVEKADIIRYNRYNGEYDDMEFFGSDDYVNRMNELAADEKEEARKRSLQQHNDTYTEQLKAAADSIRKSFDPQIDNIILPQYSFSRPKNQRTPQLSKSWQDYIAKRSDITDFIAANRDSRDITDNVADKLEMLTELFEYTDEELKEMKFMEELTAAAIIEGKKWGVTDEKTIRDRILSICTKASGNGIKISSIGEIMITNLEYTITADRTEKNRDFDISLNKDGLISWFADEYHKNYMPKSDISEITDEDFFLWAVADNMKFDNYGNYQIIDGKVKKPEAVLDAVNTIRRNIPVGFDWGNITVERIAYGRVEQSGGVSYDMKMTKKVNVAEVYAKAKDSKDWLKLKESFAKIVEKSRKK